MDATNDFDHQEDHDDAVRDDLDLAEDADEGGDGAGAPLSCPKCGAPMVPIVYGYPGGALWDRVHRGEVALGGCVVTGFDPTHQCDAGHKWLRSGRAAGMDPDALAGFFGPSTRGSGRLFEVFDGWTLVGDASTEQAWD